MSEKYNWEIERQAGSKQQAEVHSLSIWVELHANPANLISASCTMMADCKNEFMFNNLLISSTPFICIFKPVSLKPQFGRSRCICAPSYGKRALKKNIFLPFYLVRFVDNQVLYC